MGRILILFALLGLPIIEASDVLSLLEDLLDSSGSQSFGKSSSYGYDEPYSFDARESYGSQMYAPPQSYSSPAYSPPAYSPPAYSPPAYSPPAYSPPAYSPPAYSPPAYSPPAYSPPAYSPPAYSPPSYSPPSYSPPSYSPPSYGHQQQQPSGYGHQQQQQSGYGHQQQPSGYGQQMSGYGHRQQSGYKPRTKKEKVYVPVVVKKKKKKMKIISVQKGFYIAGGTQLFGKYKSLKSCQKACAATPNCFAGDYNPWLYKCYIHSNFTACGTIRSHKKLIHFKKVPCTFPEAPMGRVILGTQVFRGIEQKGIKSLSDCLKKCANAGTGIPATAVNLLDQICFGVDYDFGTHRCYFHVDNSNPANHFCPADGTTPPVPRDTVPNPSVITILLCPGPPGVG